MSIIVIKYVIIFFLMHTFRKTSMSTGQKTVQMHSKLYKNGNFFGIWGQRTHLLRNQFSYRFLIFNRTFFEIFGACSNQSREINLFRMLLKCATNEITHWKSELKQSFLYVIPVKTALYFPLSIHSVYWSCGQHKIKKSNIGRRLNI